MTASGRGPVAIGLRALICFVRSAVFGIFGSLAAEGASFSSHIVTALRLRWDLRGVMYKIELFLGYPGKFVVAGAKTSGNPWRANRHPLPARGILVQALEDD